MKRIISLVEEYNLRQKEFDQKNSSKINKTEKLELQLKQGKGVLLDLRIYIRSIKFKDSNEEINSFKHMNPISMQILFFIIVN